MKKSSEVDTELEKVKSGGSRRREKRLIVDKGTTKYHKIFYTLVFFRSKVKIIEDTWRSGRRWDIALSGEVERGEVGWNRVDCSEVEWSVVE